MGSKSPSTTTSQTKIDPELMAMYKDNYGIAMDFFNQGFEPYTDDRIAEMTPDQLAAMEAVRGNFDSIMGAGYRDRLNELIGQDGTNIAAGQFDPSTFQSTYVDPFYNEDIIEGVMSGVRTDIGRQVDMGQQAERDKAIRAGAFGNNRLGLQEGLVQARGDETIAKTGAGLRQNMLANAQKMGTDLFKSDVTNQLTADIREAQLNNQLLEDQLKYSYLGTQDEASAINQLGAVGDALQAFNQLGLDQLYADFRAPEADFYNKFNLLNSVLSGIPIQSSTTTTQPGGSLGAGILGGAAGGAGIASALGGAAALGNPLTAALVIGGGLLGGL